MRPLIVCTVRLPHDQIKVGSNFQDNRRFWLGASFPPDCGSIISVPRGGGKWIVVKVANNITFEGGKGCLLLI